MDGRVNRPVPLAERGARGDGRASRIVLVFLSILLLLLYSSFRTRNHYWDGIGFALNIEGTQQDALGLTAGHSDRPSISNVYFNPNHLGYNLMGFGLYRLLHPVFPTIRALDLLTWLSTVLGVAACALLFLILQRWFQDSRLSLGLTLLMALSAAWWKFSTDANVYVPSVFFLLLAAFVLTDFRERPSPAAVAALHTAAILLHQIAFLFVPAVALALSKHPVDPDPKHRWKSLLAYGGTAGMLMAGAYLGVWFGILNGGWSLQEFLSWITFNSGGTFAFQSVESSLLESLRSSIRVMFGGRVKLALAFCSPPLLVLLIALMLGSLMFLAAGCRRIWRTPARWGPESMPEPGTELLMRFCLYWTGSFVIFLLFWLTEYPYYRLFYLPAGVILLGTIVKRTQAIGPLFAFVVFMAAFNFAAYIYPYSKPAATPPVRLALDAGVIWRHNAMVLYKDFTCDNWIMRYFNPQTIWRRVESAEHGFSPAQAHEALQQGRAVWIDTSLLGHLNSSPDARRRVETHFEIGETLGVTNGKHYIQFARLTPVD